MSTLFQRLHARGHGGLSAVPTLQPVSALYRAHPDPAPAFDVDSPADLPAAVRAADPVGINPAVPAAAGPSRSDQHRFDVPQLPPAPDSARMAGPDIAAAKVGAGLAAAQPANVARPKSDAKPRPVAEPGATKSVASPRGPGQIIEKVTPRASVSAWPELPPSAVVNDAAQGLAPAAAITRPTTTSPLERLFVALESPPTPRAADLPAASATPPAPVSIGRIDISVAPPPAASSGAPRTQGFASYAGLRRGLER